MDNMVKYLGICIFINILIGCEYCNHKKQAQSGLLSNVYSADRTLLNSNLKDLLYFLKDDSSIQNKLNSASELGDIKAIKALEDLVVVYKSCSEVNLKISILKSFLKIKVFTEDIYEIAIEGINSDNIVICSISLDILYLIRNPYSINNIKAVWPRFNSIISIKKKIIKTLCAFSSYLVYDTLLDALKYKYEYGKEINNKVDYKKQKIDYLNPINRIIVEYFEKDGYKNLTNEMLMPLVNIAMNNNNNGRLKAIEWIGNPKIWDKRVAQKMLILLMNPDEHDDVRMAAREVLLNNPDKYIFETIINQLSGDNRINYIDYILRDIIQKYIIKSSEYNENNPGKYPDYGVDKIAWIKWWEEVKGRIAFNK